MNDLISRQAALDALEWKWAGKAAIDAIKSLPSAQHMGEWMPMIDADPMTGEPYQCGAYCSECGCQIGFESNFCPDCGAEMRGGENEN